MSLTVTCTSCGKRFQAPESMLGKLIRCRTCGAVFEATGEPGPRAPEPAPAASGKPKAASPDDTVSNLVVEPPIGPAGGGPRPGPVVRRRSDFFRSPAMEHIDRWLPPGLILVGLLSVLLNILAHAEGAPGWLGWTRVLVAFGLLAGIMIPLANLGLRIASRMTGAARPRNAWIRLLASFSVPFLVTKVLWNLMNAITPEVIFGAVFALLVSGGVVILLFRLSGPQMVPVASAAVGGFAGGALLSLLLGFGANYALNAVVNAAGWAPAVPTSPIAHGMPWTPPEPEPQPPPVAPRPPVTPPPPDAPPPRHRFAVSPIVLEVDEVVIPGGAKHLLRPAGPALGVIRRLDGGILPVDLWSVQADQALYSARFAEPPNITPEAIEAGYALSPDGRLLARVTDFPLPRIQFWSFAEAAVRSDYNLPSVPDATVRLVGFIDATRLLYRQDSKVTVLRVVNAANPSVVVSIDLGLLLPPVDSVLAISADGQVVAAAVRTDTAHEIRLQSLTRGDLLRRIVVTSIAHERTIPPSGLAISPDGSHVLAYYEDPRTSAALLVVYDTATGSLIREITYPSSPLPPRGDLRFRGSSILYFPDSRHLLLYGDGILHAGTGRLLGRLEIPNVVGQRLVEPNVLELTTDVGGERLIRLTFDLARLGTPPTAAP